MFKFVIPFHFKELVNSSSTRGEYAVEEVFSTRSIPIKLQEAKKAFARDGGIAVLQHFDAIYSVIYR